MSEPPTTLSPPATPHEVAFEAQWAAFLAALPELIAKHHGSWVVWLDGVRGTFPDEEAAYAFVDANLPLHAGTVVAPAEEPRVIPMSGLACFDLTPADLALAAL